MSGRIYVDVVTVGNISIYNVLSNPDGALQAPIGSLAVRSDTTAIYQNVDGGTTWATVFGGVPIGDLKTIGETLPTLSVETNMTPIPTALAIPVHTLVFTAPEDMTVKYLVFNPALKSQVGVVTNLSRTLANAAFQYGIGGWIIAGTGPDVGSVIDGAGAVPGHLFAACNIGNAPELNIRMAAGDTLTLDIYSGNQFNQLAYQVELLYQTGLDMAVKPKRFIAPPAVAIDVLTGLAPAVGAIQVLAAPLAAGDNVVLNNIIGSSPFTTSAAAPITYGGQLTGIAGPRTPGNNDFDATTVGITPMRDEILAALSDPFNQWAAHWTFLASGVDSITVQRNQSGPFGNTDRLVSTTVPPGNLVDSGPTLGGGTSGAALYALSTPSVPMTIERLVGSIAMPGVYDTPAGQMLTSTPYIVDLLVNAAPSGSSPVQFPADPTMFASLEFPVPLIAVPGDTIDVERYHPGCLLGASWCAIGEAL